MILSRRWRHPAAVIGLMVLEFCLTVPILALFGIASPDLYRTKLWEDGADNGFNSSPQTLVYAAANYRPMDVPDVWSQFTTNFNLVISVLSTFILLTKSVMFIMHTFIPLISLLSHALLVALYAVSVRYQTAPDTNDPDHPQNGPPWYITKDCGVASDPNNVGYCKQAKTAFILTCLMLAVFSFQFMLAIWSSVPTKTEKAARHRELEEEEQQHKGKEIIEMSPESELTVEQQWEMQGMRVPVTPMSPGAFHHYQQEQQQRQQMANGAAGVGGGPVGLGFQPVTPRTQAFNSLSGPPTGRSDLPFRNS